MPLYKTPDFRRLPRVLASIFASANDLSFFALPQWYDLMARLGPGSGREIRLYTDDAATPTVALPLYVAAGGWRRGLASLANYYSMEHGPIAAPGADVDAGLRAIVAEIQRERPRWACLRFGELDPREPSFTALRDALRGAGWFVECAFASGTWYENTAGMSFAAYLAQRPSELRNTWRRKRRGLDRGGRSRSAFFPGDLDLDRAVADYQAVYATSWKEPEPFGDFMPALIRLAAELGALRLGVSYYDGTPAAAQFWILWNGRAVIYKLAHDRRLDALSLGTLLTMAMMERVLEDDHPAEINFGRGDDPYKRLWLPRRRERWRIDAYNRRTAAGLALGLKREAAKLCHRLRGEPTTPASAISSSTRTSFLS